MKHHSLLPVAFACAVTSTVAPRASAQITFTSSTQSSATSIARLRLPQPGELNVLMIVLDDLGTDHLSMYAEDTGAPAYCASTQIDDVPTPHLDGLRAGGVLFTRCYVEPTCSPSRAAFLTGLQPSRTGVGIAIEPAHTHALLSSEKTLPKLLAASNPAGYACGAFGKWHLSLEGDECHPIECGFQTFDGHLENPEGHYQWRKVTASEVGTVCVSSHVDIIPTESAAPSESEWNASVVRGEATQWILSQSSPFFAYVGFSPPHAPQDVPPFSRLSEDTCATLSDLGIEAGPAKATHTNQERRLIHRAMIEAVDAEIGALVADVTAAHPDTMVIVVGDNGTPGPFLADPALSQHGKRTLFELGTRAPLIVSGPIVPLAAQGGTCRNLVNAVDLYSTVANLTGVPKAAIDAYFGTGVLDSQSFARAIQQPASAAIRTYAQADQFTNDPPPVVGQQRQRSVTDGMYRYMRYYDSNGVTVPGTDERLYATWTDPCEQIDLLHDHDGETVSDSAIANPLRAVMDAS